MSLATGWTIFTGIASFVFCILLYIWHLGGVQLKILANRGKQARNELKSHHHEVQVRLIVLVWSKDHRQEDFREVMLRDVAKGYSENARYTWYFRLEKNTSWALNISPPCQQPDAILSLYLPHIDERTAKAIINRVRAHEVNATGYWVNQTVYTEYGEYSGEARSGWDYKRAKDWEKGQQSPYAVTVTSFPKKPGLTQQEFMRRWHEIQSPMSETIQPRARYVRNEVYRVVLPSEAPHFDAFVIESWPSHNYTSSPFLFFNACSSWDLIIKVTAMMRSVVSFSSIMKMQGGSYAEYQFE